MENIVPGLPDDPTTTFITNVKYNLADSEIQVLESRDM